VIFKILEAQSCDEDWPKVIAYGHIEEYSSGGDISHHSLLPEVS
jgi:hypothetical protein